MDKLDYSYVWSCTEYEHLMNCNAFCISLPYPKICMLLKINIFRCRNFYRL